MICHDDQTDRPDPEPYDSYSHVELEEVPSSSLDDGEKTHPCWP